MTLSDYEWDVSYDPDREQDVILIDVGDHTIYLTKDDLRIMLEAL